MKKFLRIYKPNMIAPIVNKIIVGLAMGVFVSLLWKRFVNIHISVVEHGFFLFGLIFFSMAWFNYLQLDGLNFFIRSEESRQKAQAKKDAKKALKSKNKIKTIVDYVDEEIPPDDSLTDREKMAVNLFANLLMGLIFIIPSLIAMYF